MQYLGVSYEKLDRAAGIRWAMAPMAREGGTRGCIPTASEIQPRAFCELYGHDLVTGAEIAPEQCRADDPKGQAVMNWMKKSYQYYADGRLWKTKDEMATDSKFDRSYSYDRMGRITQALTGIEARGGTSLDPKHDRPYKESFAYDGMNHLTARTTHYWDQESSSVSAYVNDRNTDVLDRGVGAAGNMLRSSDTTYNYDAAGW